MPLRIFQRLADLLPRVKTSEIPVIGGARRPTPPAAPPARPSTPRVDLLPEVSTQSLDAVAVLLADTDRRRQLEVVADDFRRWAMDERVWFGAGSVRELSRRDRGRYVSQSGRPEEEVNAALRYLAAGGDLCSRALEWASSAGLTPVTLEVIEGERKLEEVAEALGCTPDELRQALLLITREEAYFRERVKDARRRSLAQSP